MSIQNLDPKGLRLDVYRNAAHGGTGATKEVADAVLAAL